VGTYSSIFVASPIVYHWPSRKQRGRRPVTEKAVFVKEKEEPGKPITAPLETSTPTRAKTGKKKGRK
jgi:hypothetical protein